MLELLDINAFYGLSHVLWDLSLHVEKGEIVTLLGPNGAGKSTAINVAQGLVRPSSGQIRFEGEIIQHLPPHRVVERGLCLVPEQRHLFPDMSVLENLELGAFPRSARVVKKDTLHWIFDLFPILETRKLQKIHTLSGGEQQMVAIGRGLMAKPRLIMMDEPSLGLAPLLVSHLFRTISEINLHGITVLLAEQNAQNAMRLARRAYVIETGRVTQEGSAKELLADPSVRSAYLGM